MSRPSPRMAAAALLAAMAACRTAPREPGARDEARPAPTVVRTDTGSRRYTEADAQFMRHMMAHHAQALVMTALVPARTGRQDIRLLAQRIDASQRDETALMERWLRSRGQAVEGTNEHHAHHGAGGSAAGMPATPATPAMPGMLTAAELARLDSATGPDFDRLFLEYMIRHHEGALTMVAGLLATPGAGQEPEIFRFLSDVDADQRAEIRRMRTLTAGPTQ